MQFQVSSMTCRNTTILKRILNGFRRMLKVQNHVKEEKVDNYLNLHKILRIKHITSSLSNLLSNSAENSRVCPIRNVLKNFFGFSQSQGGIIIKFLVKLKFIY